MKLGKKLISFLLCAAMLLSVAPLQALPVFAGSGEAVQATDIAAGETLTAEVGAGETVYYRFVPDGRLLYVHILCGLGYLRVSLRCRHDRTDV